MPKPAAKPADVDSGAVEDAKAQQYVAKRKNADYGRCVKEAPTGIDRTHLARACKTRSQEAAKAAALAKGKVERAGLAQKGAVKEAEAARKAYKHAGTEEERKAAKEQHQAATEKLGKVTERNNRAQAIKKDAYKESAKCSGITGKIKCAANKVRKGVVSGVKAAGRGVVSGVAAVGKGTYHAGKAAVQVVRKGAGGALQVAAKAVQPQKKAIAGKAAPAPAHDEEETGDHGHGH
jgi:hypothetical protein